jgi:hypothetical protein
MRAAKHNIVIEQGATWKQTVIWNDSADVAHDITSYDAILHIREYASDVAEKVELTELSGITITGAAGQLDIVITATATGDLTFVSGVYQLDVDDGSGEVTRLMEGTVTVRRTGVF